MINIDGFLEPYRKAIEDFEAHCEKGNEFNIFHLIENIYGITEPKHSRFLAFLLNPNEKSHGQKDKYLNLFLDQLGIDYISENRTWVVEAERNNADISIKSSYPDKISVVIENKCYDAKDQPNQLYRYWYDHIYTYFDRNEIKSKDITKCRIVYLPKGDWKVYNPNSVEKNNEGELEMDLKVIENWTFYEHIICWLDKCKNIQNQAARMNYFISDYKKYWEETNVKNEKIMEVLTNQFKDYKLWEDYNGISKHISSLKEKWFSEFVTNLTKFYIGDWVYYKQNWGDLRFYTSETNRNDQGCKICLVYEYSKGITIWKGNISNEDKVKIKTEILPKYDPAILQDFEFIDEGIEGNITYLLKYKGNKDLVFSDLESFVWNAGNSDLKVRVGKILEKCLTPEVKKLFDEIDAEINK